MFVARSLRSMRAAVLATAVLATALSAQRAQAACCGEAAAIAAAATAITGAIALSTTTLVGAIGGAAKSNAQAVVAGVGSAVTQSAEMQAKVSTETQTRLEADRILRARAVTDPCFLANSSTVGQSIVTVEQQQAITSAMAFGRSGSFATGSTTYRNAPGVSQVAGSLSGGRGGAAAAAGVNVLEIAAGRAAPPTPESAALDAATWGCAFAQPGTERGRACQAAGLAIGASLPDADVRADTLLDGPHVNPNNRAEAAVRRMLLTGRVDRDRVAIDSYINRLATPLNLRALSANELQSPEGKRYITLRDDYDARMSMAQKPWRDWAASMLPLTGTEDALRALRTDPVTRDFVNARVPSSEQAMSPLLARWIEAEKRIKNPRWVEAIAGKSTDDLLREIAMIGATSLSLQNSALEEAAMLRMTVAALLASQVRGEMQAQLARQHQAATK